MTNEKLDEICSEFAGLAPEYWKAGIKGQSMCIVEPEWFRKDYEANPGKYWTKNPIPQWSKVSTDWAAAGRLMDALKKRRIPASIAIDYRWPARAYVGEMPNQVQCEGDSGPMALCLAVAALSEASGKEAGR